MIDARPTPQRLALIEDDPRTRKAMRHLLELEGFEVEPFESVESAIEPIQAGAFHGLITDYTMPGASGLDLVRAIRPRLPALRCVIISGTNPPERASLDGIHWLLKPVDFDLLLPLLR